LNQIRKRIIPIAVLIFALFIGNIFFNIFVSEKGLDQSAAAFAGNQEIDIVDALASSDFAHAFVTGFNIILGIALCYCMIRLIITSIILFREQQKLNKIIKEEL
jgi:ABC-type Fe3+ transport system permease subunit